MILFCVLGFVGICLFGAMFHFVYDWCNHNKFISLFFAVNESTWEHIKMGLLPAFIWAIIGLFTVQCNNYNFGVFVAFSSIIVLIPAMFYGYKCFTKRNILLFDIAIFIVAVGLSMFFAYLIFNAPVFANVFNIIGIIGYSLIILSFLALTFFPPKFFLFIDPNTLDYGHSAHSDDN